MRRWTIIILIAVVGLLVAWDVFVAVVPPSDDTISRVVLDFSQCHPALGVALGILLGHLLWPQRVP